MEKRRAKRIFPGFKAEIIYNGKNYAGVIDDLCEDGLCVISSRIDADITFRPDTIIEVIFKSHPKETLTLRCTIKWLNKLHSEDFMYRIGMEILDPPWIQSDYFL